MPHAPSGPRHEDTTIIVPTEGRVVTDAPAAPATTANVPVTEDSTTSSLITRLRGLTTVVAKPTGAAAAATQIATGGYRHVTCRMFAQFRHNLSKNASMLNLKQCHCR